MLKQGNKSNITAMQTLISLRRLVVIIIFMIISVAFVRCTSTVETHNTLSAEEREAGWVLLFDGRSTAGWHVFNQGDSPSAWRAVNGELWCDPQAAMHGDLVTDSIYSDFDLIFEWKIAKGGNSGVFINVQEAPEYGTAYVTGLEMQLLDNEYAEERHRSNPTHLAGSLYDVIGTVEQSHPKPFGEWNQSRIRQEGGKVTFWLNGQVSAEIELGSAAWQSSVAASNLSNFPEFGKSRQGKIALQDHTDEVFFRNMKIRRL